MSEVTRDGDRRWSSVVSNEDEAEALTSSGLISPESRPKNSISIVGHQRATFSEETEILAYQFLHETITSDKFLHSSPHRCWLSLEKIILLDKPVRPSLFRDTKAFAQGAPKFCSECMFDFCRECVERIEFTKTMVFE